ncbi:unnamed protein product, partial [Urochloa humidicola]
RIALPPLASTPGSAAADATADLDTSRQRRRKTAPSVPLPISTPDVSLSKSARNPRALPQPTSVRSGQKPNLVGPRSEKEKSYRIEACIIEAKQMA